MPISVRSSRDSRNVHTVVLEDPGGFNLINLKGWNDLNDNIVDFGNSDSKLLVIRSNSKLFSGGIDLKEIAVMNDEQIDSYVNTVKKFAINFLKLKKPVLTLLQGDAFGAGTEIILLSDLVIAVEDSKITFPFARFGIYPPVPMILLSYYSPRKMIELLMLGSTIDAKEAKEAEIVSQVCKRDEVESVSNRMIDTIMNTSPAILGAIKERKWTLASDALETEFYKFEESIKSSESRIMIRKFLGLKD